MNRKNLFLVASILSALVFIGYLGESLPVEMFGVTISIWIMRAVWLIITISNVLNYLKFKKLEEKA